MKKSSVGKLLQEIIDLLGQENPNLENAVTKTKILLYQLGEQKLAGWVNAELTGYGAKDDLPPYRIVSSRVVGTVTNGISMRWNNTPLPITHLKEETQVNLTKTQLRDSIAGLQHLLSGSDGTSFARPLSPEFCALLTKGVAKGLWVESAHVEIGSSLVVGALAQVKSRLLDFVLEVSTRLPPDVAEDDVKEKAKQINTAGLFKHAIFRGNTIIQLGSHNVQNVQNNVFNNLEALADVLREQHVTEPDIVGLKTAIAKDANSKEVKSKTFGPRVREWMKGMYSKAVDASWQIELGIAGTFLADALKGYYGW